MKIIFDHQIFSQQAYGGISRYYYELTKRLIEIGQEVEIRSPLYVSKYFQKKDNNRPYGIYVPKIPRTAGLMKSINDLLVSFLWNKTTNVDVFHETYFTETDNCPKSAVRIVTVYDMINERFPDSLKPGDRASEIKLFSLKRADHIISISNNTKEDIMNYSNIPPQKISVVHLGYMHTEATIPLNSKPTKPYLLYIGERGGYKNFIGLLEAYANSNILQKELKLVCFGGGKFKNEELRLIKKLKIKNSQIMQLFGNDDLLAQLYKHAEALVYPSLYEGFGIPPLEAMSYKCPVICSNTSSIPEVAGNAARYFDPYNIDSIIEAIEDVVFSGTKRKDLIEKGTNQAQKFSWEKCAAETLHVYKKVLGYA